MKNNSSKQIVFFDGVCALCNHSVKWIIKHDKKRVFLFAPLQGETARRLLRPSIDLNQLNTIILMDGDNTYTKSNAALQIASSFTYPWKLLVILRVFPRPVRDWVYDYISTHRYGWFGKYDTCSIPAEDEIGLFLE